MTLDDGSTGVLDLHVSQVEDAPRRRRRAGWVIAAALAVAAGSAAAGIAAVVPDRASAPAHASPSAPAPSTAPASMAGGTGTAPSEGRVIAQAPLSRAGHPAGLLTVGTGKLVEGLAPPVVNFHSCGADGTQLEYLRVEIRDPLAGLAAAVTVQPGPTTPPGIGRLGFFFESGDGDAVPCGPGDAWPTTDTFEAVNGAQLITGYVVLDQAVTPAAPQGRPDVFSSLQLTISRLRQFDDYVPEALGVGPPTVGQLCSGDQNSVCAPLG